MTCDREDCGKTVDELLSLQEQFALLTGFIEGLTAGREGSDCVRKGGISELRQMLHGLSFYKARWGRPEEP